jgi:hypothetical protein
MSWFLDKLYGIDEEEKRAAELDAANRDLLAKKHDAGKITDAIYKESLKNYDKGGLDGLGGDGEFSDDIDQAFLDGLDEGAANERGIFSSTINTLIGTPLKLIPWQVWIAAGLYVGWRLGLFDGLLKGWLKKAR